MLGDEAGVLDPETARYWHRQRGVPPRFPSPRWNGPVARDAEPLGFGLNPRLVAAFCAHPAWTRPYLRRATFKAWRVAAERPGTGRTAAFALADLGPLGRGIGRQAPPNLRPAAGAVSRRPSRPR